MQNGTCTYTDSGRGIGSSLEARITARKAASSNSALKCGAVG